MTNDESEPLPVIESWDAYWQGARSSAAYTGGGSSHPLILSFWNDYFEEVKKRDESPSIIDIASGNGAVTACASKAFDGELPDFTCLDISASAIRMLEKRFAGVRGVVADAAEIPLDSACFDIATSQFGLEYAGLDALDEVARLLRRGGELVMLMHHRRGIIYAECGANLDAVREMQAVEFIPNCVAMFEAAYAMLEGGNRDRYRDAGRQLAPSIQAMEAIMMKFGREVAANTILRVYRDVRTIHTNLQRYEPQAVIGWLNRMAEEIEAYAGRMASMRSVALDAATFEGVLTSLARQDFEIVRGEAFAGPNQETPLAWVLVATKQ